MKDTTTPDNDPILKKYAGAGRDQLIPLLQEVQERDGYLSREAITSIAKQLALPTSKVFGVATFYNQFRFQATGKYHIQVCRGTACHVKGSLGVLEAIQSELKVKPGQTTHDGVFSLEIVACLGACGLAPVICINGEFHARVTPASVRQLLESLRKEAISA